MNRGFFTLQLQVGAACVALLTAMLYSDFVAVMNNLQKTAADMQMYSASRYMMAVLEKELAYECSSAVIRDDNKNRPVLYCRHVLAGKQYIYTQENGGIYKQTRTMTTSGKNPLFIPSCPVESWRLAKISERVVKIEFVLSCRGRQKTFRCWADLLNGTVDDER